MFFGFGYETIKERQWSMLQAVIIEKILNQLHRKPKCVILENEVQEQSLWKMNKRNSPETFLSISR